MNTFYDFTGGPSGQWKVISMQTIVGPSIEKASYLSILPGDLRSFQDGIWSLKGFTSNVRYVEKHEKEKLNVIQPELGRPEAIYAALIPIKKNEAWWALAQDERRKIFERDSHHTQIGLKYLPQIARRLHHCRDIGQPFDFLTWFEFTENDNALFNNLVSELRETEEWKFVEREIDIRLVKV